MVHENTYVVTCQDQLSNYMVATEVPNQEP
jgi:hypothetical protein